MFLVHLAMFAKYWQHGKVKTRLAESLGPELASDVYVAFLRHLVIRFSKSADLRTIVYSPINRQNEFKSLAGNSWNLRSQSDGLLGQRMADFFGWALSGPENEQNNVILIGSDTPNIPTTIIQQTVDQLNSHDVVLGPSTDGGYYLVAMKQHADIFRNIPWSTPQVLPATIERLTNSNTSYYLLPEMTDVDEEHDFEHLAQCLHTSSDVADRVLLSDLRACLAGSGHEGLVK